MQSPFPWAVQSSPSCLVALPATMFARCSLNASWRLAVGLPQPDTRRTSAAPRSQKEMLAVTKLLLIRDPHRDPDRQATVRAPAEGGEHIVRRFWLVSAPKTANLREVDGMRRCSLLGAKG